MFRRYSIAALIALGGIVFRVLAWYFARPLWVDEEMLLLNVRDRSLAALGGRLWLDQSAPYGWLALQRIALQIFGLADRTGRAVPVLFGIATIALAFWAGRRWLGAFGAAVFVVLCSFGRHVTYFTFEAKQYSADVFGALLLLALAAWALERCSDQAAPDFRRILVWWSAAAIALWFSYGALFVTPACALILVGVVWRRADLSRAVRAAAAGVLWLGSFALNYWWSMRYTLHSDPLRTYWRSSFPPVGAGATDVAGWLLRQLGPLASDPGGSSMHITFWVIAALGIAMAAAVSVELTLVLLAAPLTAFLLGAMRLVPLSGRMSLWMVPALYLGVAITADGVARFASAALKRRHWLTLAVAVGAGAAVINLCVSVFDLEAKNPATEIFAKHGLNDRLAMRFLMGQRERGDVFLTTHLTLPAVWWYGGVNVADPNQGRTIGSDAAPVFEIFLEGDPSVCRRRRLRNGLAGASRAAVYFGFDSGTPPGFPEFVLDSLSELGAMTLYRGIAEGGVAVFDLREPPKPWAVLGTGSLAGQKRESVARPEGCVNLRPATRW